MCVHICTYVSVCVSMCMLINTSMSISMDMYASNNKSMQGVIIYLIRTYVHSFVFKLYTPISTL